MDKIVPFPPVRPGARVMDDALLVTAAQWHLATSRDDMDWDAFTLWLEAAPAHQAAYDAIASDDALLADHADAIRARLESDQSDDAVEQGVGGNLLALVRRQRALWVGSAGGLAAAAALGLALLPHSAPTPSDGEQVYTAPDTGLRTLALGDGVKVTLGRHASLSVPRTPGEPWRLTGTAYFDVTHRPDRLLKIQAGRFTISDIGTRFEVANSDAAVRVSVESGSVGLSARATDGVVRLTAGQGAVGYHHGGPVERLGIMPQSVGSFRRGVLVYQNASLDIVAEEISRYSAVPVRVDSGIGHRRFSGALTIGDGKALPSNLADLMGITASERDGTILLSDPGRR